MGKLSGKQLDLNFINYIAPPDIDISDNIVTNNINYVNVRVVEGAAHITWKDCSNPFWKSNILVRKIGDIPTSPYSDEVLEVITDKNKYSLTPFIDTNISDNELYCYRVFTEYSNDTKHYSGFKNIFFNYTYDGQLDERLITGSMILQDYDHRFVKDIDMKILQEFATNGYYTKNQLDILLATNNNLIDGGTF